MLEKFIFCTIKSYFIQLLLAILLVNLSCKNNLFQMIIVFLRVDYLMQSILNKVGFDISLKEFSIILIFLIL